MAQAIGKYATKRFLKERVEKASDVSDKEFYRRGNIEALDGVSANDLEVLNKVKRRARWLDNGLCTCCGVRVGYSAIVGIFPGAGDFFDAFFAIWIFYCCSKIDGGLPKELKAKMWLNILIDLVIGFMPIIGDIADAVYKCNTRNAKLLYGHLKVAGQEKITEKHPTGAPQRQHQQETV